MIRSVQIKQINLHFLHHRFHSAPCHSTARLSHHLKEIEWSRLATDSSNSTDSCLSDRTLLNCTAEHRRRRDVTNLKLPFFRPNTQDDEALLTNEIKIQINDFQLALTLEK